MNILDNLIQSYGLRRKGTGADSFIYNSSLDEQLDACLSEKVYGETVAGKALNEIRNIMAGSLSAPIKKQAIDDLVKNKIMPIVKEFEKEYDKG